MQPLISANGNANGDAQGQIEHYPQPPRVPSVLATYAIPSFDRGGGEHAGFEPLTSLLWRRKWVVAAGALLGLLAGIAAARLTSPVYRARTSLQLEGFNDRALTPVSPLPNATAEDYLQNEVKILESDTLAERVADQLGPLPESKPPAFLLPFLPPDPLTPTQRRVQRVKKSLQVSTALQSQVIELFFDAPNPQLAARGANLAASEFMNLNREARIQLVRDTTEWLDKQAGELKSKLEGSNRELQNFAARWGLVLAQGGDTPALQRVRQLQDALTRAEADRASKQALYETAIASQGENTPEAAVSAPLRQYQTDLTNSRRQLADLRTIYQPDNYRVTRLEAQIAETEKAIAQERKDTLGRMRNDYLSAASLQRTLSASLTTALAAVSQQTEKELQYNVLKNETDTTQKLYDSVLERAKDTGAESSLRVSNLRVIDPATPPPVPYSPSLPLNMALGMGFGTVCGAGLVLLRARPGKVKQPGELALLQVPELGVVPSSRADELAVAGPDSPMLRESFRAVLTSILFSTHLDRGTRWGSARQRGVAVVVTSADMMEGKTTIVSNLGVACALQKRDVLLIDADLRRPRLHQRFGLANNSGLTNLLDQADLHERLARSSPDSLVQSTQTPHLWVLTSGPADSASANLLYSPDFDAILRHFARRFDLILIDTPPVSMYSDARILGRLANGVVMVVRANTKRPEELRTAYQRLLQDRIRVLGTILNDWRLDRGQARNYARYYSRYAQDMAE